MEEKWVGELFKRIIKIERFGEINEAFLEKILGVMIESYERLGPPITYSVNLRVFESSEEGGFFACHDASRGTPTISIYMDKISTLPLNVVLGGVRRQVAHSIIHGTPEFYRIKFPYELRRIMAEQGFPQEFAVKIIYGTSMAVKEYMVTKYLIEGGFVEDQIAYAKYILEPIAEEIQSWEAVKEKPMDRITYLTMTVRDISCAIPLTEDSRFGSEIKALTERKIEHLPVNYKLKIKKIIGEVFPSFTEDTFKNIDLLTNAIVKEIICEELGFHKKTSQQI
jgi:hypothetical protein